jgi:hypothetical protein
VERERQSLATYPGRGKGKAELGHLTRKRKGKAELGHLSRKRKVKGRAWPHVQ